MSGTASGRMVFVLGKELQGNRQVVVVNSGEEYDFSADDAVTYSVQTARFPYNLP